MWLFAQTQDIIFHVVCQCIFTIYIRKSELFEIIPHDFDITIAKSDFSLSNTKTASINQVAAESFASMTKKAQASAPTICSAVLLNVLRHMCVEN